MGPRLIMSRMTIRPFSTSLSCCKMEASESVQSATPSDDPPTTAIPVIRRLLQEGHTLHSKIRQFSADLPAVFTATKSEFSPVLADFKYLKDAENEDLKIERNTSLHALYERSKLVGHPSKISWDTHWHFRNLVMSVVRHLIYSTMLLDIINKSAICWGI